MWEERHAARNEATACREVPGQGVAQRSRSSCNGQMVREETMTRAEALQSLPLRGRMRASSVAAADGAVHHRPPLQREKGNALTIEERLAELEEKVAGAHARLGAYRDLVRLLMATLHNARIDLAPMLSAVRAMIRDGRKLNAPSSTLTELVVIEEWLAELVRLATPLPPEDHPDEP